MSSESTSSHEITTVGPDQVSQPGTTTAVSATPTSDSKRDEQVVTDLVIAFATKLKRKETRQKTLKIVLRVLAWVSLFGMLFSAFLFAGIFYSVGMHAGWRLYKTGVLLSPLYGVGLLVVAILMGLGIEFLKRKATGTIQAVLLIGIGAVGLSALGYFGARSDNPYLTSQSPDLETLSKSAKEHSRILGQLSETGNTLVQQLTATEQQLADAKTQLGATLMQFDQQKQSAAKIEQQLKDLNSRRQAIALKTEELERILEGQKPITRQDLQRSSFIGLVYGTILGFLGSLAATFAFSRFAKKNPRV